MSDLRSGGGRALPLPAWEEAKPDRKEGGSGASPSDEERCEEGKEEEEGGRVLARVLWMWVGGKGRADLETGGGGALSWNLREWRRASGRREKCGWGPTTAS